MTEPLTSPVPQLCRHELEALHARLDAGLRESRLSADVCMPILRGAMEHAAQRAAWIFQKCFIAELHRYAASAAPGRDERQVFEDFVGHLAAMSADDALRQRYAFLLARFRRSLDAFAVYVVELARHLHEDRDVLVELGVPRESVPQEVKFGCGDPHNGARGTLRYRFAEAEVYYKPRPLELDRLFARLQRLVDPHGPVVHSITRDRHGWQKAVTGGPAEGAQAAGRFYRLLGSSTAIAHLLCGSDLHFENIVSDAQGVPYFVDLEALFTNPARADRQPRLPMPILGAEREFDRRIAESIFSVGVVSLRRTREGAFAGAAQGRQVQAPVSREVVLDPGTSRMRLARVRDTVSINSPVPRVDGQPAAFADHLDGFCAGYREAAATLAREAERVRGWLQEHAGCSSRQILRHTFLYGLFTGESTHPAHANEDGTRQLLGRMRREEAMKPYLERVFAHETEQMLQFDIPCFEARLDGLDLHTATGRIEGFFERPVLDIALERLQRMGDEEWVGAQLGYVATLFGRPAYDASGAAQDPAALTARLLQRVSVAGEGDGTVLWTYSPPPDQPGTEFAIEPMGPDLYTGLAGVLTFLLRHDDAGPWREPLIARLATTARRLIDERKAQLTSGAYSGMEGLLLALSDWARQSQDPALMRESVDALLAREGQWGALGCDVIDGCAGLLLVALAMHRRSGDPRLLPLAERLAARLVGERHDTPEGPGWTLPGRERCITGFAHGGSGIAYALAEAGRALDDPGLIRTAVSALRREDTLFDTRMGLWPDTREAQLQYSLGWCNGAAGFLLARSACWEWLEPWQHELARTAFDRSCAAFGQLPDDSLCHGTAGVYLALRKVATQRGWALPLDPPGASGAPALRTGWHHDPNNLGLMVGLSGTGLARMETSERSLCPLTLA